MTEETPPDTSAEAAAPKRTRRPKPGPGRHGTGEASSTASAAAPHNAIGQAPTTSPRPRVKTSRSPTVDALFGLAQAVAAKPADGALTQKVASSVPAKAAREVLGLEDTIAVAVALVALRTDFTVVHVETSGTDPLRDEILSIHALRVERRKPVAEFNTKVLSLRALPGPEAGGGVAGQPSTKQQRPGMSLEEAMAGLCRFLATRRQHVFAHGAARTQAWLGQAARQYGMVIENPVGDLIGLAKLAWPDRNDYGLAGLAADLLSGATPIRGAADATNAILGLLEMASKQLTADGGLVSRSIVHWGTSPDTVTIKQSPW